MVYGILRALKFCCNFICAILKPKPLPWELELLPGMCSFCIHCLCVGSEKQVNNTYWASTMDKATCISNLISWDPFQIWENVSNTHHNIWWKVKDWSMVMPHPSHHILCTYHKTEANACSINGQECSHGRSRLLPAIRHSLCVSASRQVCWSQFSAYWTPDFWQVLKQAVPKLNQLCSRNQDSISLKAATFTQGLNFIWWY